MKEDPVTGKKVPLSVSLTRIGRKLQHYMVLWFVLLLAIVYGFVSFRIYSAQAEVPTADDVSSQLQATATPHVDPSIVAQMQNLKDHSANVRTLFEKARSSPFNE